MANRRLRDQVEILRNRIIVRSKSQTESKQDWANYLLIINSLKTELFIVSKM